jgi:hypothetical protein
VDKVCDDGLIKEPDEVYVTLVRNEKSILSQPNSGVTIKRHGVFGLDAGFL